jgi:transmembrane sensor
MTASRIEYLFNRYVNKTCSPQEEEELMELLRDPQNEATFKLLIEEVIGKTGIEKELLQERADSILSNILQHDKAVVISMERRGSAFVPWMRIAAAVLLVIAGAFYWMHQNSDRPKEIEIAVVPPKPTPILPGTDKAVLTMADGSAILLDSAQNGLLAQPGNTNIQKRGTVLIYVPSAAASENSGIAYNTLSTPRGGQYKVVLSDGTSVWLNAASSLRFPTAFIGDAREVELTGEAYFEVAKNKDMPFHVKVNGVQVNVIGTHFNINAYSEEAAIKTSLLEGSVQVTNGSFSNRLKPGEQAIVSNRNEAIDVRTADMDAVMAWKNGLFVFEGADIEMIMRQISRWYDVDVVFTGETPAREFEGKISRNAPLSNVLKILELSSINFSVEGKKIIVR